MLGSVCAIREFKKLLWRWQRQHDKTTGFNEINNGPARAFKILVHFPHHARPNNNVKLPNSLRFCGERR